MDRDLANTPIEKFKAAYQAKMGTELKLNKNNKCPHPNHADSNPSFNVKLKPDGSVSPKCFTGCDYDACLESLDLKRRDCFPRSENDESDTAKPVNFRDLSNSYSQAITPPLLYQFAESLRLPVESFASATTYGFDGKVFTHTEVDASGNPVGIVRRTKPKKVCVIGSRRGIYLPRGWESKDGPVFLVEGFSDTTATNHSGLSVIGRPSNEGGVQILAEVLCHIPNDRPIIVVGENDKAETGKHPGLEGAQKTARELSNSLGRTVSYALVPPSAKDSREWLTSPDQAGMTWSERGKELRAKLIVSAIPIEPDARLSLETRRPETSASTSNPPKPKKSKACIIEQPLRNISKGQVKWLWLNRIPSEAISILEGDPGLGKSFITLDLTARVSRGWAMPPEPRWVPDCDPKDVILVSAEDSLDRTIKPRLMALGADEDRITCIETVQDDPDDPESIRPVSFPKDLPLLEEAIHRHKAALIVIDPFSAMLTDKADSNKESDMRRILHLLKLVAERTGAAILIVRHLNKMSTETNAIYRGGGSIGVIGAARSAFSVGPHPDDESGERRVLARVKGNLCATPPSLEYRVEVQDGVPVVHWEGEVDISAHELNAKVATNRDGKKTKAKDFLVEKLTNGEQPAATLEEQARQAGIAPATLRRAKSDLGVSSRRAEVSGCWYWSLA